MKPCSSLDSARTLTSQAIRILVCFIATLFPVAAARAVNPVQTENLKAGTNGWQLSNPAINREIEGYASLTSVNLGDSIDLFVNTAEPTYTIELYRMGWYGGAGARLMQPPVNRPGIRQPLPFPDYSYANGYLECNWNNPYTLSIPNNDTDTVDWISGVYLAKLTGSSSGKQSYIIFVVRDDSRPSDLLYQQSVTTYEAYNNWGGKSLYEWNTTGGRAWKVSFNRPYALGANRDSARGVGAGEFLTNLQQLSETAPAGWEYNMVRFLEREGYDVSYSTDIDTHESPNGLLQHKAFLSVGHDEYWSWQMRQNVEAARDHGVSLGFFSANTCYWQVRFEPSLASGAEDRTMVSYKNSAENRDPVSIDADPTNNYLATSIWRDPPLNRPENTMIGVMFETNPVDRDVIVDDATNWAFAGTGLIHGDRLSGLAGYEVDRMFPNSPPGTLRLAHSAVTTDGKKFHDMTVYLAASGATVFAVGSIQWSWGLDDYNAPALRSRRLSPAAQQITRNVLTKFVSTVIPPTPTPTPPPTPTPTPTPNPVAIRIMPLGDSITFGVSVGSVTPGGYRTGLWNSLVTDGWNVDFVGSLSSGPSSLGDKDNEGHIGYRIDQISASIDEWLTSARPSVVLLMIGTNDVLQGDPYFSAAPSRLSALIDKITTDLPGTQVLVSSISPLADPSRNQRVVTYNSTIPSIVSTKISQGKRVRFVDMYSALTTSDLSDGIHPNAVGYGKMANLWYKELKPVLSANTAVNVSITSPSYGATFFAPATITISANATNSAGTISRVDFYQDTSLIGTAISGPYTVACNISKAGIDRLTAVAVDNSNTATTSSPVFVTVDSIAIANDFNDNVRDLFQWSISTLSNPASTFDPLVTVLEQNRRLEVTPRANAFGQHYSGYVSAITRNVSGGSASVEVVSADASGAETVFALGTDSNNFYRFLVNGSRLIFQERLGGVTTSVGIAYDRFYHRFWRIRHDAATDSIVFETSSDGSNWNDRWTLARRLPLGKMRVELGGGTARWVPAPGKIAFDNFLLVLPPP